CQRGLPLRSPQHRLPARPAMSGAVTRLREELGERARAGLSWWLAELAGMLPHRPGRPVRRAPVALEYGGAELRVRVHGAGGGRPAWVAVDPAAPQEAAAGVQAALRQGRRGSAAVV